jgi:hypothetical protein
MLEFGSKNNYLFHLLMSPIIICFRGRLGNQLFQVALGMYLEANGYLVRYDLSATEPGKLDLYSFTALGKYLKSRTLWKTKYLPAPFGRFGIMARAIRRTQGIRVFYSDYNSTGEAKMYSNGGSLLDGFWQRKEYCSELLNFLAQHPALAQFSNMNTTGSELVVQIRRGDFVVLGIAIDIDFYLDSIESILLENPTIQSVLIVTDDPEYCRKSFQAFPNIKIISGEDAMEDFHYMVASKFLLISQSTFAWWAANIGEKKVYYPAPWFADSPELDDLIIPQNWIPIQLP